MFSAHIYRNLIHLFILKSFAKYTIKSLMQLICANKVDDVFNIVHSQRQLAVW